MVQDDLQKKTLDLVELILASQIFNYEIKSVTCSKEIQKKNQGQTGT